MAQRLRALTLGSLLLLVGATAQAEGTDDFGTSQGLLSSTRLLVDIQDDDEHFVFVGTGSIAVFGPDGADLGAYASGEAVAASAGVGTYSVTVSEDQPAGAEWDLSVAGATGRLSSQEWLFDAGSFDEVDAANASFFVLVGDPLGASGVIELRFDGLAGYEYSVLSNRAGVRGPNAGRSVRASGHAVVPEYRLYVNPPEIADYLIGPTALSEPSFIGGPAACSALAPGSSGGEFVFDSTVLGTFQLICDTDQDSEFELIGGDDFVKIGAMSAGENRVSWDGVLRSGELLGPGEYSCIVRGNVGEVHWIGDDIETSFGGVRMFSVSSDGARTPLSMHWDDGPIVDEPSDELMFNGEASAVQSPAGGLDSGDPSQTAVPNSTTTVGNARGWGDFTNRSKGNNALLDTFGWIFATSSGALAVQAIAADTDSDSDGATDIDEICRYGTDPEREDSDGGGRSDGNETNIDGTNPTDPTDDIGYDFDEDGLSNEDEFIRGTDPANPDTDGDGRLDGDEVNGDPTSDPFNPDTDGGGVRDGQEVEDGTDPNDSEDDEGFDFDGDGLSNEEEFILGTDPSNPDTDGDGRLDGDEVNGRPPTDPFTSDSDGGGRDDGSEISDGTDPTDPTDDLGFDFDNDGLSNEEEFILGTDPSNPDTDGDGRTDGEEVNGDPETDPFTSDSDGGGQDDGGEISDGTDPNDPTDDLGFDFDGDGLSNEDEFILGTDPSNPDTDGDGRTDGEEVNGDPETDPFSSDSDDGGRSDGAEILDGTDPNNPNDDRGFDFDRDGLENSTEFISGTDPSNPDTDGDGLCDGNLSVEGFCVAGEDLNGNGTVDPGESDPFDRDTDDDGLLDGREAQLGTDPTHTDSDRDGIQDGTETGLTEAEGGDDTDPEIFVPDVEPSTTTDPLDIDTDDDGLCDGPGEIPGCANPEDVDGDGKEDAIGTGYDVSGGQAFGINCASGPGRPTTLLLSLVALVGLRPKWRLTTRA